MAAKVCKACNSRDGRIGCEHWEQWPDNISRPHNWTDTFDLELKVKCQECGLVATIPDLANGITNSFGCPRYKIQRPAEKPQQGKPRD